MNDRFPEEFAVCSTCEIEGGRVQGDAKVCDSDRRPVLADGVRRQHGLVEFEVSPDGMAPADNAAYSGPYADDGTLVTFGFNPIGTS